MNLSFITYKDKGIGLLIFPSDNQSDKQNKSKQKGGTVYLITGN